MIEKQENTIQKLAAVVLEKGDKDLSAIKTVVQSEVETFVFVRTLFLSILCFFGQFVVLKGNLALIIKSLSFLCPL